MAEKTYLSSKEVSDLLMVSPLDVYEWVQQGKLHARLQDGFDSVFSREELRHFALMRGMTIGRPDKNKLRILIVDNDVRLTRFLVELFDTLSDTVEASAVHSAFEAGQSLQSDDPDIVLLDLQLPNQEGIEMCRRIKSGRETRHVRLLTMTEQLDEEHIQRSLMLGAEACLAKPIDHQKLFKAMGLCMEIPAEGEFTLAEVHQ
jgi:CheY-like chemotaxis protein